ncbi:3',5'-cyclic AMP phosphodiesterase CpdA [Bosea sp. BE125]|uniref:metallophosphoesterase family protein n=1 Tax=Bosea sp. BE125 TaxID=2817909 RepID=UPI00286408CE|nr:metallophosphoesterase [Bosea sp. BE125]MDR6869874.1 3',5'-cyclic AMP phosphodiesterase CpdA [Bosea sp. BE125]
MFKLAHLSDPHLGPLAGFSLHQLLGKRATGYVNWRRKRRHAHDMNVLALIVADIRAQAPDHVACTGDVAHIGLPNEFKTAVTFLDTLGPRDAVSFVPGNHDAYAPSSLKPLASHLGPWCADDEGTAGYPWYRRRGPVALIGLNSGIPTLPLMATGRLGQAQIAKAEVLLNHARNEGLIRVVLIHHPPYVGGARRARELVDAEAFEAMLARSGADLILHGHNHTFSLAWRPGLGRDVPIVGVPSASIGPLGHGERATWHLFKIEGDAAEPRISVEQRGFEADGTVMLRQDIALHAKPV